MPLGRKHPTRDALIFGESWSKTNAASLGQILAQSISTWISCPLERYETTGFLNPAGAGIAQDELIVGPIPKGQFIEHEKSCNMKLYHSVSLADAMRAARQSPDCNVDYSNVFFLWEHSQLVMIVRKSAEKAPPSRIEPR